MSWESDLSSTLSTIKKFITISYFFYRKKKNYSLYFDILGRLTGVTPHQMSWRYDMLTLMLNKAHLLQNLEATHIPPEAFLLPLFLLGLSYLQVFKKEDSLVLCLRIQLTSGILCISSYLSSPTCLINHTWVCNYFSSFLWRVIQSILILEPNIQDTLRKAEFILRNSTVFCLAEASLKPISVTENDQLLLKCLVSAIAEHLLCVHLCGRIQFSPIILWWAQPCEQP